MHDNLEQARASMKTILENMDTKLDKLKESSIWLVLAAVIGVVLGRLGL